VSHPTTHQVAQVVIEEMMKWSTSADEKQRRDELYALSDRLIRFFEACRALEQPYAAPGLPGLPGGPTL